jgi:1,4-dihydroxy-2-naphthoate octaprenyltransferase
METLRLFVRLSRPVFLLGGFLCYALGAGIARYLGVNIDWGLYWLGQAWVTLLQLSAQYINEYFDMDYDRDNQNRTPFSGGSGALGPGGLPRQVALIASAACLSGVAYVSITLMRDYNLVGLILFIMILTVSAAIMYSVPPLRLVTSGYGELMVTFLVAFLLPAFAFILQKGMLHRLLAMTTFPLFALHMAMMISFEFPDYASDLKHDKKVLLVRLGWQRSMLFHNLLILCAFLILGLALLLGMPYRIGLPAFLALPLGLVQIWQMHRIASGHTPNWRMLTSLGLTLFGFTTYLLTYSYWIQ